MARVKLGDVANEYKEVCKGSKEGLPVVGLEHLTPEELTLSAWDDGKDNTFTKMFRKGQVLFGRRRAYQKKAVIAPFDGICSGDITVIEALPDRILPDLLPFIVQNDSLFDYAVGKSAGSLSPRVKWEHLRDFDFELPSMPAQRTLADILWAAQEAREAYKRLLTETDNLVKSQFIEMFGDPIRNSKSLRTAKLGTLGRWASGGTPSRNKPDYYEGSIEWFSAGELNSMYLVESIERITEEAVAESAAKVFPSGSMLIGMYDTAALKMGILTKPAASNQACANIIPNHDVNIVWLYWAIEIMKPYLLGMRRGVRQKNLNQQMIKEFCVPFPSFDLQNRFAAFVETTDKSKFALQHNIERLEMCRNALMQKAFG